VKSHSDVVKVDHCPICSVVCTCSKCKRRLKALALEMKRLGEEQGTEPASTAFEDIFTCLTKPQSAARVYKGGTTSKRRDSIESTATDNTPPKPDALPAKPPSSKTKTKNSRKSSASVHFGEDESQDVIKVSKVPPPEFPREVRNGVDIDPGTSTDYLTVYTAKGSYIREPDSIKTKAAASRNNDQSEVVEDGNVDYCQECRTTGNLVCCDFCPRAFHQDCLDGDEAESEGKWECHHCRREKEDLPEYELAGKESEAVMCATYGSLKGGSLSDDDMLQLSILSKFHEMVEKLMAYHFGYMFCSPVPKDVPGYTDVVKHPMDLGTVGSNLVNGKYKDYFQVNNSWDDVHIAVLKDIELVWHNCFTYNFEGSSIYRMAEVHRKRMQKMLARSLDSDLSDNVKNRVREYVIECEKERGKFTPSDIRPTSRHKISVKVQKGGVARPVAVFDPDTGRIVKIYTTMKSAYMAAEFISKRQFKHELKQLSENEVKTLVNRSPDDPSATLFGYRWMPLERLRQGQVVFAVPKSPPEDKPPQIKGDQSPVFEMTHGGSTYIFLSIDEALSFPRLPKDLSVEDLRIALQELSQSRESVSLAGLKWRRLKRTQPQGAEKKDTNEEKSVTLAGFWRQGASEEATDYNNYLPENATIAKEDVVTRRIMVGYQTLEAAFEDWVLACKSSPSVVEEEMSQSHFHTYYLDGDRNVDGLVWKTIDRPALSQEDDKAVTLSESATSASQEKESSAPTGGGEGSAAAPLLANRDQGESSLASASAEADVRPSCAVTKMGTDLSNDSSNHGDDAAENRPATTEINLAVDDPKSVLVNGVEAIGAINVALAQEKNGVKKRGRNEDDVLKPRKKKKT
jgi:hypothetical protein